jgi:hypothetical protein
MYAGRMEDIGGPRICRPWTNVQSKEYQLE